MALSRIGTRMKNLKIFTSFKSAMFDYKAAAEDVWADSKNRPLKASIYTGLLIFGIYSAKNAPSEKDFGSALTEASDKLCLVSEQIRNKSADDHINKLENYQAKARLRYLNCGIISLVYYSKYDKDIRFYESQCKYLKPRWSEYPKYIVDVGFLGRWWILQYRTTDYDVNFEEFPKDSHSYLDITLDSCKKLFGLSYFGNPAVPISEQKRKIEVKVE